MVKTVLSKALICDRDNFLKAVDVFFDQQILEISPLSARPVLWKDIAAKSDWHKFTATLPANPYSDDIRVMETGGLLLMPGAIDPHVHFNTPGFEYRDDFEHGSTAAAAGGVTTIIDMPCTSVPPVTTRQNLESKRAELKNRSCIDYAFWGGVAGNAFKDSDRNIRELAEAGVVGFKAYFVSGMPEFTALSLGQMLSTSEVVKKTGLPLAVHAENGDLVLTRQKDLIDQQKNDWQAYCQSRDVLAEAVAVAQLRELCRRTGCRIHIVHLSSGRGLNLIREACSEHLPLSAETCPHYLTFTQIDFENPDIAAFLKTAPPVKTAADRQALWEGLADESLLFVATDHAGCDPADEKTSTDFWQVYGGIPGVEHRVPFLFSEGFKQGRLTLEQTIALLSGNAARYFGLTAKKGSLNPGKDADFALIDLWTDQVVRAADMHSKGKYTPLEGRRLGAVVQGTWLRGRELMDNGRPVDLDFSYGRWIRPG